MKFQHLEDIDQTYSAHFRDAIRYSWISLKCSFYFCIHSLYPDIYKTKGSKNIQRLNEIIQTKLKNFDLSQQ